MIRLIGHWQTDKRIEKSLIFVQGINSGEEADVEAARVPERITTTSSHEQYPLPSLPPPSTTLNPFRANTMPLSSSSATLRVEGVDKGVEAFKRLMLENTREGSMNENNSFEGERTPSRDLAPSIKLQDSASLVSHQTDPSTTGMTFVYTSDEEDDVGSAVKHSPETLLRESPQPILTSEKRSPLPPLTIPTSSPAKPAPPPSRRRGASGSNQVSVSNADDRGRNEISTKRTLPPAPPAPRRSPSSASTSQRSERPERTSSIRREPSLTAEQVNKPPPPRPRRKLSDTSVTSLDVTPSRILPENQPTRNIPSDVVDAPVPPPNPKRLSTQAPPPPPPPRHSGRKVANDSNLSSPTRRSTDLPTRLTADRPDSPRRSSAPDKPIPDSELSLELGRLQREVDELVYGLTKKRGKD